MLEIVRGSLDRNATVKRQLDKYFADNASKYEGILYLGYPIIGEGVSVDALWVSPTYSIVVFDLYEGAASEYTNREEQRDFLYNEINSSLMKNNNLMDKRKQLYNISVYTFAPSCTNTSDDQNEVIYNLSCLDPKLEKWSNSDKYEILLSAIQVATKIRGNSTREIKNETSKGAILKNIENSIATLDISQNKAVIETSSGIQRIRGLAGSGKTIILALKAAYLHSQNPNLRIAITFNTRSLKPMFLSYINRFVWEYTKREPDLSKVRILNAWGGLKDEGLYSEICERCEIPYINFAQAKKESLYTSKKEFEYVCDDALNKIVGHEQNLYDIILVDEAQDLPNAFFKLCEKVLKKDDGRLVIAYDELQNLTTGTPVNIKETFKKADFENKPNEPKKDIILPVCYRNPKEIIVSAHAIGFGIYREYKGERELVQFFDNPNLWNEVGYKVVSGQLKGGKNVILARTSESSPTFVKYAQDDIILCQKFSSISEEAEWVCEQINHNIKNDELKMRDILVIVMASTNQEQYAGELRNLLYTKYKYNSHIAGITTSADSFFQEDSITFSGIFRAKGNEAAIVYIIGVHNCMTSIGTIRKHRNELFTAITRSKMWVRITGVGDNVSILENEVQKIKDNNFTLNFEYPTDEELKRIDTIYSDYDNHPTDKLKKLLLMINNGELNYDDLSDENKQLLKEIER